MKRFIALGALALCLISGTAMADKARNIVKVTYSDKTSPDSHKGMTGWLNADYVDCYCDGYLLKDLNGDGNDELIILPRSSLEGGNVEYCEMLYAVYTMKNGKPIRVLESWTRSRNYLCVDGGIYNEGSDGASYSTWCIRDIENGRIVVREGVQTADKMDANGEYLEGGVYLRMTESHDFYDGEEISEEQADADLARYQNMLLNDDSGFVPFAEYKKK